MPFFDSQVPAVSSKFAVGDLVSRVVSPPPSEEVTLPIELWLRSFAELIHDPELTPSQSANNCAAVACVSKTWKSSLSCHQLKLAQAAWLQITAFGGSHELWYDKQIMAKPFPGRSDFVGPRPHCREIRIRGISGIRIGKRKRIKLEAAQVKARPRAEFALNLSQLELPAALNIASFVDAVFDCIGPSSSRWRSFELCTENPFVFKRVQTLCADLPARWLTSLKLSYVYMPGFSDQIHAPAVYDLPFQINPWFLDDLPRLSTIRMFCAPINWSAVVGFESLEVVELTDFSAGTHLDPGLLPALFSGAPYLRVLVLGALRPFAVPSGYRLVSSSLQELDVEFYKPVFIGDILSSIVAPALRRLTVRQVYQHLHALLACPALLARIESFTAYSSFGDHVSIQHLFSAMPDLIHLDLTHSVSSAFEVYCLWAASRTKFNLPDHSARLVSLAVGRVRLHFVVEFIRGDGAPQGTGTLPRRLRRVRIQGSEDHYNITRLRALVPDFAVTDEHSPYSTRDAISGPTGHSMFPRVIQSRGQLLGDARIGSVACCPLVSILEVELVSESRMASTLGSGRSSPAYSEAL
ncbi:hypothetical protein C8R46DRAFT_1042694 [Mycena filopes]|nr:hypothetical protein C8R46DRAFT_1042694 [Mycena filopes]